jgi:O-antigen/teichoic acid export membrane protein
MLATVAAALFGFVFWILIARSFNTSTVGLATTLIASSSLISLLGLAGFDTVFIRFLAKSKRKNDQINSGLLITAIVTIIVSVLFCLLIPVLSPKLQFVDHNARNITIFIVFTIFTTWNMLTNAILISFRRTSIVLLINIIFSAVKVLLPFTIRAGGPMMIFTIVGIAQVINVILSLFALAKYFNYVPSFKIHFDIILHTLIFSMVVYLSNLLNLLPDSALPFIVLNKLGTSAAAYFYIAFTIANILYTIAFATSQALLAEISNDDEHFKNYTLKGLKIISVLLVPGIIILYFLCPYVLNLFGHNYKEGATSILRILSISGFAVMFYAVLITIYKFTNNLKAILAITSSNALVIILFSLKFVNLWGLNGVGWAWLIGSVTAVLIGCAFLPHQLKNAALSKEAKQYE